MVAQLDSASMGFGPRRPPSAEVHRVTALCPPHLFWISLAGGWQRDLVTRVLLFQGKKCHAWSVHIHITHSQWRMGFRFLVRIGLTKTLRLLIFDPSLEDKHLVHNANTAFHPRRRWDVKRNMHACACSRRKGPFSRFMSTLNLP